MKQGIILAAGLGRRLHEITQYTPKSLIRINDKPVIERNIEWMLEAGIERIVLVTGYMKDRFAYLKEKYSNLHIVYNAEFMTSNTVSSLNAVKTYLTEESYITTADIYITKNVYNKYNEARSFYLLRPETVAEKIDWIATVNDQMRIVAVDKKGRSGHTYSGISHWMPDELAVLRELLEQVDWKDVLQRNQYWDELLLPYLQSVRVEARILENDAEIYEFDDMGDIELLMERERVQVAW